MRFMKGLWESLWSMSIDRRCDINEGIQDIRKVLYNDVKLDQLTACLKLKPISLGCHFFEGDEAQLSVSSCTSICYSSVSRRLLFGRMVIHLMKDLKLTLSGSWTQNSVATSTKVAHFPNHCTLRLQKLSNWQFVDGLVFFAKLVLTEVAVKISVICFTVASCNRIWSGYGLVQREHRNCIKHETVNKILMVHWSFNSKKSIAVQLQKCLEIDVKARRDVHAAIMPFYQ